MGKHKRWWEFYVVLLQYFGQECKNTALSEVIAALVGGIAGAVTAYLRTSGKASFTDALFDGVIGAAVFFGFYAIGHIIQSPWLEHKGETTPNKRSNTIIGATVLTFLVLGSLLAVWLVAVDWRSAIVLSASADQGGAKATQLTELENCKTRYAALTEPESKDSLRRRTIRLANQISDFLRDRYEHHPPYAYTQPNDPDTSDAHKAAIKTSGEYDQKTADMYARRYKDQAVGIIREYNDKGVNVGYLEHAFTQQVPVWAMPGSGWENSPQDNLGQFKELAFHVTAKDQLISLADF